MKKLLLILILTLNFQTLSKADDIREFEIEGMSIGDTALDFFSKEVIDKRKVDGFVYPKKDFFSITFYDKDFFKTYDAVQLHLKANDTNYIIYSIGGRINFKNNYKDCINKMEDILPELKKMFSNATFYDAGTLVWKNTSNYDVKTKSYYLSLQSGEDIALECYDQPEEANIIDGLNIAIDSKEFVKFLSN